METKHTKGEWEASQENMRASKYWWQIRTGMGAVICNTPDNSSESEANAKLIAAAPDLLEALIKLSSEYKFGADCGDWGNWKAEEQPEYIQAINAIKKATE